MAAKCFTSLLFNYSAQYSDNNFKEQKFSSRVSKLANGLQRKSEGKIVLQEPNQKYATIWTKKTKISRKPGIAKVVLQTVMSLIYYVIH